MQGGENVVSCIYNVACPGYGAYFYICMPVGPRLRGSVRRPGCRENGPGTEKSCEKERGTSMAKSGKNRMLPAVIGCVAVQLCVGILYVWSVFKQPAISFFGWDGGSVNLVASFMLFCFCFGNLIGGILQDRIGPKPVCIAGVCLFGGGILISSFLPACAPIALFYLAYCLVAGVGSGFAYGAVLSCIQKWFPHKRGFASGLGAGAFGLSTVVFSPVIQKLLGEPQPVSPVHVSRPAGTTAPRPSPRPSAPCLSGCCFWAASSSTAPGTCSLPLSRIWGWSGA